MKDIALDNKNNLYVSGATKFGHNFLGLVEAGDHVKKLIDLPEPMTGMTADSLGNLYLAGKTLYKYNIALNKLDHLGLMNYECAGDLAFWNGELLMTTNYLDNVML